jgi:hypothetical protein
MSYHTVTTRYEPVTTSREHRGKCSVCGKPTVRRRTFQHTVNPFNKNEDGSVRTRAEVWKRVNAVADEWIPDFRHDKCRGATDG